MGKNPKPKRTRIRSYRRRRYNPPGLGRVYDVLMDSLQEQLHGVKTIKEFRKKLKSFTDQEMFWMKITNLIKALEDFKDCDLLN